MMKTMVCYCSVNPSGFLTFLLIDYLALTILTGCQLSDCHLAVLRMTLLV